MTHEPMTPEQRAEEALERVNDIKNVFKSIRDLLKLQIEILGPPDKLTPKPILTKLAELQTAQITLVKAEEAFYDKIRKDTSGTDRDFDAIRDQIGRALDRIRAAERAGNVFIRSDK